MAAHTDLTHVCLACLTRVPPSIFCPSCRRPDVAALGEAETTTKVKLRLESRSRQRALPEVFYRWGDAMFFGLVALVQVALASAIWEHWKLSIIVAPEIALFAWCSVNDPPSMLRRFPRPKSSNHWRLREILTPASMTPTRLALQLCLPLGFVIFGLTIAFHGWGRDWGEALLHAVTWAVWGWPSILAAIWLLRVVVLPSRGSIVLASIVALLVIAFAILRASHSGDYSHLGNVVGIAAALLLGVILTDLCRLFHLQYMEDALKSPVMTILPNVKDQSAGARTVTGQVEADSDLIAPLSGESCVAFRITGKHPLGLLDDGRCLAFIVVSDDGERVPVDVGPAWLQLPTTSTNGAARLSGNLEEFLRPRGVTAVELVLDEGLLRNGDRVTVTGQVETQLRPEGYRGTTEVEALVGRAETPLIIRSHEV